MVIYGIDVHSLKTIVAVGFVLTLFGGAVLADPLPPLPPEIRSAIADSTKRCGKEIRFEKGFITRRDINGDGIKDFILDYGHFSCGDNTTYACGSGGCLTQVFASLPNGTFTKVLDDVVRGFQFETVRGTPAMLLQLHGSSCGKVGSEPCSETLYWNGQTFSPAH